MTGKIEIIRKEFERTPVAYVGKNSGAVYFPGRYGKCITKEGEEIPSNNPEEVSGSWNEQDYFEPLYEGDTIRITKEIVL